MRAKLAARCVNIPTIDIILKMARLSNQEVPLLGAMLQFSFGEEREPPEMEEPISARLKFTERVSSETRSS